MKTEWQGYYLDGKSASRQPAVIHLMKSGLEIVTENRTTLWWPYKEIRQTQGSYAGEHVRLERGKELSEAIVVSDTAFLTHLHRFVPGLAMQFHNPGYRSMRIKLTVLAGIAGVCLITVLYFWGIPAMAALVAPHVPVAWEEHLGKGVVEVLAPKETQCTDPGRMKIINEMVMILTTPLASQPYTLRVSVVNHSLVNAFAAPGGYIVIFRGLLEHTKTPEELAGVLAHELQHILKRHATQAFLHDASTGILLAALAGDASGAMAYGLETARTLGMLRYSRQKEDEADAEGMQMLLEAGVDPSGMISFFEMLEKEDPETPEFMKYLSTHPATQDRVGTLKSLAGQSQQKYVKLFPGYDWKDISKICQSETGSS
jgi:Zn-dependent protease with chaperone function